MTLSRTIIFGFLLFTNAYAMSAHETKTPCLTKDEKTALNKLTEDYYILTSVHRDVKIYYTNGMLSNECIECEAPLLKKIMLLVDSIGKFIDGKPHDNNYFMRVQALINNNVLTV